MYLYRGEDVTISKTWAMPNGKTFTIKPIRQLIEREIVKLPCNKVVVDPFANGSTYGNITNDLNPEYNTNYHMDALAFLRLLESESADMILYDPPYSITQASQLYKSYGKEKLEINVGNMKYWAECKNEMARICKRGGKVLCCGWNTNGLGKNRNFVMEEVLIVSHGGSKNDTLVTLERKGDSVEIP